MKTLFIYLSLLTVTGITLISCRKQNDVDLHQYTCNDVINERIKTGLYIWIEKEDGLYLGMSDTSNITMRVYNNIANPLNRPFINCSNRVAKNVKVNTYNNVVYFTADQIEE